MAKRKNIFIGILVLSVLLSCIAGAAAWIVYGWIEKPNVSNRINTYEIIFIPTGSDFDQLMDTLRREGILKNEQSFKRVAEWKKFNSVKPGRYRIEAGWSNNQLINFLRIGKQEPVDITFHNIRSIEEFAGRVARKLEFDSLALVNLLRDEEWLSKNLNATTLTILTHFIPNTYRFNWNTTAVEFMQRMNDEYNKFWNEERNRKASALGLSRFQVATLASIVQSEQRKFADERPLIAGLYLKRLQIGMPLQSDPTLIFAMGNPSVNRVLDRDKEIDSPYNTYKYSGLPPGPILLPDVSSIDAVLNPDIQGYLYMCAKEDFSGRHYFAKTLNEHNRNAAKYRKALNKSKILR